MTPARALLVVDRLAASGTTDLVLHLVRHLDRARVVPEVLALRARGGAEAPDEEGEARGAARFTALGVPARVFEMEPSRPLPLRLAALGRWLARERFSIVHAHSRPADYWCTAAAFGARVPVRLYSRQATYGGLTRGTRVRYAAAARLASRVVAVSEAVRAHLREREHVAPSRIVYIPDGIDLDALGHAAPAAQTRGRLGIPSDALVVGTVASLTPRKGQRFLIEAAERLLARHRTLHVLLVGEGPERAALEARVRASRRPDAFRFLGERADVVDLIAALDVFVLPSLWEGLNLSLLTACALGRAVVASQLVSNREILGDGEAGLLPTPRAPTLEAEHLDAAALAGAIERLLVDANLRRAFGRRAAKRVRDRFDARTMAARHDELYAELLHEAGGRRRSRAERAA